MEGVFRGIFQSHQDTQRLSLRLQCTTISMTLAGHRLQPPPRDEPTRGGHKLPGVCLHLAESVRHQRWGRGRGRGRGWGRGGILVHGRRCSGHSAAPDSLSPAGGVPFGLQTSGDASTVGPALHGGAARVIGTVRDTRGPARPRCGDQQTPTPAATPKTGAAGDQTSRVTAAAARYGRG